MSLVIHTGRIPFDSRIYPVTVKPRTHINRWHDWPDDCVDRIRDLVRGWYGTGGVFVCDACRSYCHPHPYGVPHIKHDDTLLCDDCLIALARS